MTQERIEISWDDFLAAKGAYSVSLFDKGSCKVFDYEGRHYTTWACAYSVDTNAREAWCYEVVSPADYTGEVPIHRWDPTRRGGYPGILFIVDGTDEEVVVTNRQIFLKTDEPEEDCEAFRRQYALDNPRRNGKGGKAYLPVTGQLSLL